MVKSYVHDPKDDRHAFVLGIGSYVKLMGFPVVRGFGGLSHRDLSSHASRAGWNKLAKEGTLLWEPLDGANDPGEFTWGGNKCTDGDCASVGMKGPGHKRRPLDDDLVK